MRNFSAMVLALGVLASPAHAKDQPGLVIQNGESWAFRVDGGQPVGARKVGPDDKPAPGELLVRLTQEMGTSMFVYNNTPKFLNYRAQIMRKPGDRAERTSVCTLLNNGRFVYEGWPYAIAAIYLSDFTEAPDNSMVCK